MKWCCDWCGRVRSKLPYMERQKKNGDWLEICCSCVSNLAFGDDWMCAHSPDGLKKICNSCAERLIATKPASELPDKLRYISDNWRN